jgi:hypothetical protein
MSSFEDENKLYNLNHRCQCEMRFICKQKTFHVMQ